MKEWKLRQKIYHALNPIGDFLDDVEAHEGRRVIETVFPSPADLVESIKSYFHGEVWDLIYPTKSYVVAITYAWLLEVHFGEDMYEVLDDPDLLFGNDKWFVPYSQNKKVYNAAIDAVSDTLENMVADISKVPSQLQATVQYFMDEFMVTTQGDGESHSIQ